MADEVDASKKKRPGNRRKKAKTDSNSAKGTPWTFPKNTLEDSIAVAKAIEEKNAGNPIPAEDLAVAVDFRQANDWRFLDWFGQQISMV